MIGESNFGCVRYNLNHEFRPRNRELPPKAAVLRKSNIAASCSCYWGENGARYDCGAKQNLWLDGYLKSISEPSTSLSLRTLCSGVHLLRPSFSMCIFTLYDHRPAKTNRSNFIKDMRCRDPIISHEEALNAPPPITPFLFSDKTASSTAGCLAVRDWGQNRFIYCPLCIFIYFKLPFSAYLIQSLLGKIRNLQRRTSATWSVRDICTHTHTVTQRKYCFVTKYGMKTKLWQSTSMEA